MSFDTLLSAFVTLLLVVDPLGLVPTFIAVTEGLPAQARRHVAQRACIIAALVLAGAALGGDWLFRVVGITLPAFRIAGGIILLLIGIEMLQARRSQTKESPGETEECVEKEDVGIIPMGIPMLAGPGAISAVMVMIGSMPNWWYALPVFSAIAVTALLSYWILAGADRVRHYMGETGIRIMARLMGLVLTAMAVQFILDGIHDAGALFGR